jgi:hypothetical protein
MILEIADLTEPPEMPEWITCRAGLRPVYNSGSSYRPITFYRPMSEHWSAIAHWPIHRDFVQASRNGPRPLPNVVSIAFRADFPPAENAVVSRETK